MIHNSEKIVLGGYQRNKIDVYDLQSGILW